MTSPDSSDGDRHRSPSSSETDPDLPDGVVDDDRRARGLPPGADTKGDEDDLPGQVREAAPYDDAPAEGRLAPDGDNPPPPA